MKIFITVLCSLLLSLASRAQPAVLLGPDLEPVSVELEAISPTAIRVIDAEGKMQTLKPQDVLRLTLTGVVRTTPGPGQVRVTLRDGQVIVGDWFGGGGNGESIVVGFGFEGQVLKLPLDDLLSIAMRPDAATPIAGDDDVLLLATGETLTGFVEWIGAEAIEFVVGDADEAIKIPLDRINALSIANKPLPAETGPGTMRIKTRDGSAFLLNEPTLMRGEAGDALVGTSALPIASKTDVDRAESTATAARVSVALDEIVAIEPASTRHRLVSLSEVDWRVLSGSEVFGVAMPPRLSAEGSLRLHAPVEIGFDLPTDAKRLVFTVEMDLNDSIPDASRQMAGCELVAYEGQAVIARHTLTPDGLAKRLNLPLTGGDLRFVLEQGVNGPVLDRVRITDAELLVSE